MNDAGGSWRAGDGESRDYAVPVGPVRGGGPHPALRTLAIALLVGTLGLLVGMQVGPSRGMSPGPTAAASMPSGSPTQAPAAASLMPDRSVFASTFDAISLLSDAGLTGCVGGGSGGGSAGLPYEILSVRCPAPVAEQSRLILQLERAISMAIRSRATSRDAGLNGGDDPAGSAVMSWDYSSGGFDGSIYLMATHTDAALVVALILTEQPRA